MSDASTAFELRLTNLSWLPKVPNHWAVHAPKYAIGSRSGGSLIKGECASEPAEGFYPAFSASGQDVWLPGFEFEGLGLVLSAVGARCGKTFKANGRWSAVANTHCLFPKPGFDRNYLWYLTNQEDWWDRGGSAQPFVLVASTLDRPWAFPPAAEQRLIANFLDRETARIDALIEKKTRFIELLREKRQVAVFRLVTKGIDETVPMQDVSAVWINRVPLSWRLMALARLTISRCDGPFGSAIKSEHYADAGVRVIRLQNIGEEGFRNADSAFLDPDHCREVVGEGHEVRPGDILMAGLGDENNPLGRACVAPASIGPAIVKADCYRFRVDEKIADHDFVALQLSALARAECGFMSTGATRDRLNLGLASSRRVALPRSLQEQKLIVEAVRRVTFRLDSLLEATRASIDLLRERRAALITAAVTGQIDVRAEAPIEETEPA